MWKRKILTAEEIEHEANMAAMELDLVNFSDSDDYHNSDFKDDNPLFSSNEDDVSEFSDFEEGVMTEKNREGSPEATIELKYELTSRGLNDDVSVDNLRKAVRSAIQLEANKSLSQVKNPFSFTEDKLAVEVALTELTTFSNSFQGDTSTTDFQRFSTLLLHAERRCGLMSTTSEGECCEHNRLHLRFQQIRNETESIAKKCRHSTLHGLSQVLSSSPKPETRTLRILRRNLTSRFKDALALQDVNTIDQLLILGKKLEFNQAQTQSFTTSSARYHTHLVEPELAYVEPHTSSVPTPKGKFEPSSAPRKPNSASAPFYTMQLPTVHSLAELEKACLQLETKKYRNENFAPPVRKDDCVEPDFAFVFANAGLSISNNNYVSAHLEAVSTNKILCWNCKRSGHIALRCPEPRGFAINVDVLM
ncbi:hypothetical protein RN001_015245 [Aquatica leii]|uniref:CCHC-type domain-containing protein n=1 Tax=Aquatica leii TaxID=1421715 RepID=A0AAN7P343_9COLE|nr:hypothetical protein RN001_015245 [Aquatica leii]